MCIEKERHINTNYAMTGHMLYIVTRIREDVINNSNGNLGIRLILVSRPFLLINPKKSCMKPLSTFWSKYTNFNNKNDTFGSNEFIWSSKDICADNSRLCYHKYSLPCT